MSLTEVARHYETNPIRYKNYKHIGIWKEKKNMNLHEQCKFLVPVTTILCFMETISTAFNASQYCSCAAPNIFLVIWSGGRTDGWKTNDQTDLWPKYIDRKDI